MGLALLGLLGLVAARIAPAEAQQRSALASRLAAQSLLLGVARAGDRLVAVGERGHVVLSDDGGGSWRQARSVPTQATLTDVYFVDSREGWAVGHDAVVLHTRDAGESWELEYARPEADAPLLSVWFETPRHGIAVGAFSLVLETRDGGTTWTPRQLRAGSAEPTGQGESPPPEDYHLNHIFGGPEAVLFVAAEFGSVFRSRDAGASWERLHPPYEGSFWGGLDLGDALLVFGMRGQMFRSPDLGETWQAIETGTEQSLQSATRLRGGGVVVVGLGGTLLSSRDAGRSFSAEVEPDRVGIAAVIEDPVGGLLLFGENGVRRRAGPEP